MGFGNLLAVRPKHELEYELTLKSVDICEGLLDGVEIKGQFCEVSGWREENILYLFFIYLLMCMIRQSRTNWNRGELLR